MNVDRPPYHEYKQGEIKVENVKRNCCQFFNPITKFYNFVCILRLQIELILECVSHAQLFAAFLDQGLILCEERNSLSLSLWVIFLLAELGINHYWWGTEPIKKPLRLSLFERTSPWKPFWLSFFQCLLTLKKCNYVYDQLSCGCPSDHKLSTP